MNKKESMLLLDKYTNALKAKAEAEENMNKAEKEFKVDPSDYELPFTKILMPFLGVSAIIALAVRIAVSSSLKYNNELPVTLGLFAGAAAIGFIVALIVYKFAEKEAQKNLKSAKEATLNAKENKISEYKAAIGKANYKIAEAESVLPVSCRGIEESRKVKNKLLSGKAETLEEATGGYTSADWEEAYAAKAKMFSMPDGTEFGGFAITEATRTILPKDPRTKFASDTNNKQDWRMVLVSLTKDSVLGDRDYYELISGFDKFILDSRDDEILIRGLSLKELEKLMKE